MGLGLLYLDTYAPDSLNLLKSYVNSQINSIKEESYDIPKKYGFDIYGVGEFLFTKPLRFSYISINYNKQDDLFTIEWEN